MIKMDLIAGTFKLCSLFSTSEDFVAMWYNPNPLEQPENWDIYYRGERTEAECRVREAVKAAQVALLPEPEPETYTRMLFRGYRDADIMVKELKDLNILAEGSDEYETIRDEYERILDWNLQCRHRYCGTCNGVACEESVTVEIPNSLLNATLKQREKAVSGDPSSIKLSQWQYDDEGRCHW